MKLIRVGLRLWMLWVVLVVCMYEMLGVSLCCVFWLVLLMIVICLVVSGMMM